MARELERGVPGTSSWMTRWRESPNQSHMLKYAQEVERHFKAMSAGTVDFCIKQYLSGKWDLGDEAEIAAAIRRMPIIEGKYNLMEVERMSKKEKKTTVKKVGAEEKSLSLEDRVKALEIGIEALTVIIKGLKKIDSKPEKPEKKEKKAGPVTADIEELLKELKKAKENGDKNKAFKIRGKLRKAGYSLRANGKK